MILWEIIDVSLPQTNWCNWVNFLDEVEEFRSPQRMTRGFLEERLFVGQYWVRHLVVCDISTDLVPI